jgi:putative ABC transport system permease protein
MFKTYLKTTWRSIAANKLFTSLNVAGLAAGLCVCIILFAAASNELSFDRMYANAANIYRVNMETTADYGGQKWAELPNAVGPALLKDIPGVKQMTRLIKHDFGSPVSIRADDKNFVEKGIYLADTTVFRLFDFHFTEGNAQTAFAHPHSIVISAAARQRLFGNQPATGKSIYINGSDTLYVSGVYKDLPENSTIDCDMVYNIMDSWMGQYTSWDNASFETYCLLQPGADIGQTEKQATSLIDKYVKKEDRYFTRFLFQPLTAIHLYSAGLRPGYTSKLGSISTVKALLFLSLLVVLIACINYMNLATARSQKRSRSVGVNKVLGANTRQMLSLFYAETAVLTLIAIVIGYALSFTLLPLYYRVTGMQLASSDLCTLPLLSGLLMIWLLVTFIAGSYPAIALSRISALVLMKKSKQKDTIADYVRKALVVFQFTASGVLIIAVIVILQQVKFIRDKDLGYNPAGIVSLSVEVSQHKEQWQAVMNDLKNLQGVENVTAAQSIPGNVESGKSVRKLLSDPIGLPVETCHVDGDIVSTMQLKLLAGHTLPVSLTTADTTCYTLINEAVLHYLGYKTPQEAIGRKIITEMSRNGSVITGVVQNFNYQSLKNEIGGYMYYTMNHASEPVRTLLVRYNSPHLPQLMQQMQNVFRTGLPIAAFDYQFLDTYVQNLYASEQHMANTATIFSLLAVFIACLGLFGLAAFTAEQRTKEIGIRKVLGASVQGITRLLAGDFLKLVFLAILIASPVAWWLMDHWLTGFTYRITIGWGVFVIAGIASIGIALITVSFQAIKAAIANPVKSLRTE